LEHGQTLDGDLVVFGGNVTIETQAVVEGSLLVFGGTITSAGEVEADIVIFGGQIDLAETAHVQGDIITIGGQISQAAGAVIGGDVIENIPAPTIDIPNPVSPPDAPDRPELPTPPNIEFNVNPFMHTFQVFGNAVVVAALAMLLILFLQPQIERVGLAITSQPLVTGSIGLLTVVLAPFILLLLVITILLIPVAIISVLLLILAWLFGIIAIGQEVGERLAKSINQTWAPVLSIGVGTFLVMLLGGFIGLLPCIGWLVPTLAGFVAIGGAAMTWFGTRQVGPLGLVPASEPIPPAS
jgi:hypothetical protein